MPLENVIDTTENCRHSLMCRHMCPVGNVTNVETLSPHGWAQLVALERRGVTTWNALTVDALYQCADCGSCRSHCVTDQPLPEAIAAARANLVSKELAPAIVYELADRFKKWQNPYEAEAPAAADGKGEVALFVGDEARHLWPAAIEAAVRLLKAAGVEPVLIGAGRSDGYMASALGLPDIATDLARANLNDLEGTGARHLLVLSPGAYFAFGQLYDERLGVKLPEDVRLEEVTMFLANRLADRSIRFSTASNGVPSAYVDPTHSVRVKSRYASPRILLRAIRTEDGQELFWRQERAYPCGNLALQFTHPELADRLTRARLEDAVSAGAQYVVTDDPGSLAHLQRHAPAFGVTVQGLYELLAENLL